MILICFADVKIWIPYVAANCRLEPDNSLRENAIDFNWRHLTCFHQHHNVCRNNLKITEKSYYWIHIFLWLPFRLCCHNIFVSVYTSARMVAYEVVRDKISSHNKDGQFPVWCVIWACSLRLLLNTSLHILSLILHLYFNSLMIAEFLMMPECMSKNYS